MVQTVRLRPVEIRDAAVLGTLYTAQRAFLAPFEPVHSETFFTEEGQRAALEHAVALMHQDRGYRFCILADDAVVGILSVSNVVRKAFQSATLGYFVAREWNGQGIATAAVGVAVAWALGAARLHRLEAATLPDNLASQRVLIRNGFTEIGLSPRHLQIAGAWRDHILFARTASEPTP
jgi:ribosomal-protein-alanine N-acetyltransferase